MCGGDEGKQASVYLEDKFQVSSLKPQWLIGVALCPIVYLGLLSVAAMHIKAFKTWEQCSQMSALGVQMLNHTHKLLSFVLLDPVGHSKGEVNGYTRADLPHILPAS